MRCKKDYDDEDYHKKKYKKRKKPYSKMAGAGYGDDLVKQIFTKKGRKV